MKFGFIGLGNMAGAIIHGMITSQQFNAADVYGMNRSREKTEDLVNKYGIQAADTIEQIMEQVDVIVIAVKPQMFEDVLPTIKNI